MEKDQVVFRSDARALIKLDSVVFVSGSQGHLQVLRDAESWQREEQDGTIFWRMSENCIKGRFVQLSSEWAGMSGPACCSALQAVEWG